MAGIVNGLQQLWNGILTLVNGVVMAINFGVNFIKSMFQVVRLLIATMTNTTTLLGTLPTWLIAFGTCTVGVAVMYLIVGRESGK